MLKLSLCLTNEAVHHEDVQIHVLLTSAQVGDEWSTSRPGSLTPWERAPGIHWIGGYVSLRTGLDDVEKIKILPLPGLELRTLGRPARSQSLYRLRYPGSWVQYNIYHKALFWTLRLYTRLWFLRWLHCHRHLTGCLLLRSPDRNM
jgi:hypothetical protein